MVSVSQHPSVHRAVFLLESLGGLLSQLFVVSVWPHFLAQSPLYSSSDNSASSNRSPSLTFPFDWSWERRCISQCSEFKDVLGGAHIVTLQYLSSISPSALRPGPPGPHPLP